MGQPGCGRCCPSLNMFFNPCFRMLVILDSYHWRLLFCMSLNFVCLLASKISNEVYQKNENLRQIARWKCLHKATLERFDVSTRRRECNWTNLLPSISFLFQLTKPLLAITPTYLWYFIYARRHMRDWSILAMRLKPKTSYY